MKVKAVKRVVRVTLNFVVVSEPLPNAADVLRIVEEAMDIGCEYSGFEIGRGKVEHVDFGQVTVVPEED